MECVSTSVGTQSPKCHPSNRGLSECSACCLAVITSCLGPRLLRNACSEALAVPQAHSVVLERFPLLELPNVEINIFTPFVRFAGYCQECGKTILAFIRFR